MAGGDFIGDCNILSTFDVGADGGTREDLLDIIVNISPEETTFLSSWPKVPAANVYHEWLLDSLEQPGDPDNGVLDVHCTPESSDAVFPVLSPRCRVGNYTHILRKTYDVSETQRAVNNAGLADEYAYQKMKALKELAMLIEFALIHSQRQVQAAPQNEGECVSPQTCRRMDGLLAIMGWATTDFSCLDSERQGTTLTPVGSPCHDLTLADIDDLNELMWAKGANPKTIYVNAFQKRAISALAMPNGENRQIAAEKKMVINSIDYYESDFGLRAVKLHRYIPNDVLVMLDEDFGRIAVLRPVKSYELAKVGNSDKGMVEGELTLEWRAPAGAGQIDNLCTS
jgi:hypothetical protein